MSLLCRRRHLRRHAKQRDTGTAPALLLQFRGHPGQPSLGSVQDQLEKLEIIRQLDLPADMFSHAPPHELERYRQRVAVEAPYELRRHPEPNRLTWLAAFAHLRGRTLIDDLIDLLVETIHHIGARTERKVDRELLEDVTRARRAVARHTASETARIFCGDPGKPTLAFLSNALLITE
jgi:hypothetical protein